MLNKVNMRHAPAYDYDGKPISGSYNNETVTITISPHVKTAYPPNLQNLSIAEGAVANYEYSLTLVHEIFHYNPNTAIFNPHDNMAGAAYNALNDADKAKFKEEYENLALGEESGFFNKLLRHNCPK